MHDKESIHANCGVVGIYGHKDASQLTYLCLFALQHRGQESAGIVSSDGSNVSYLKKRGLVSDIFSDPGTFNKLPGYIAIGHNRYSTTGGDIAANVQPLVMNLKDGPISISHNGNLVDSNILRAELMDKGSIFQTTTDNEILIHMIARSKKETFTEKVKEAVTKVKGAFTLVLVNKNELIAIRDPKGFRPLCIGRKEGAYIFASESCALDLINAKYIRDVKPGEMVVVNEDGFHSEMIFPEEKKAYCIFEYIYFSRPDSKIFGDNVDKTRRKLGKNLAIEKPAEGDIVVSVPDSSNTAALGYAQTSDIKFEIGLIRNHYIGRTFIHPIQKQRDFSVRIKFNPVEGVIKDKRVILIEDSIVRGTTLKKLVNLIKNAGAKEIHVRISSPPIISPCYYGMDFPTKSELIANNKTVDEIRSYMKVDTLEYLTKEGLLKSVVNGDNHYCTACFTGDYPVPVKESFSKGQYDKEKHC
ncbi:MAG: amidophosphoribosyltransferase [bacterium]|nr:amidophosphoribosyltransferase [bacterium]